MKDDVENYLGYNDKNVFDESKDKDAGKL